ncbi:MEDS domain-containing protein [Cryobacterium roopkundense]|nr:MEDS domain-containing protein [Cryobacterium roopkundense]MBB5643661.1 hypothetical protein [Cryobacterium roopkundense]
MAIEAITLETGAHVVHFHQDNADLITTVGGYAAAAIKAGDAALVVATRDQRVAIAAHLEAAEIDVVEARRVETFVSIDAAATLARFYADGQLDAGKFHTVIGGIIAHIAARTGRTVRCHGSMAALLWDAGAITAAIELEKLWNDLTRELDFSRLCTYLSLSVAGAEHSQARRVICGLHSDVVDNRHQAKRNFRPRQPSAARMSGTLAPLTALTLLHLRPEVHQASGMVSVQLGVDPARALDRLRVFAASRGQTLEEVAKEVVSRQLRFNGPEPQ